MALSFDSPLLPTNALWQNALHAWQNGRIRAVWVSRSLTLACITLAMFVLPVPIFSSSLSVVMDSSKSSMQQYDGVSAASGLSHFEGDRHYLITRMGGGTTIVQDAAQSPLRYIGFSLLGGVEYRATEGMVYFSTATDAQGGSLMPTIGSRLAATPLVSVQVFGTTSLGVRFWNDEALGVRVYAGGILNGLTHLKIQTAFGNSAIATDICSGLGAFARAEYRFVVLGKEFRASSQWNIPLVGIASRPSYSTPSRYPATLESNPLSLLDDVRLVAFTEFPLVGFRNSLEYALGNGNLLALTYDWDFYSYQYFNTVQSARHGVAFSFHFLF